MTSSPHLSAWLFTALVGAVAVQRLFEMRISDRNVERILAGGGQEHAPEHFGFMKAVHATWLVAMLAEVWLLDRTAPIWLSAVALAVLVAGQGLRYAAMRTLGERWTVRIYTLPDCPPVVGGPYRYLRHPNYLGVVLEIAALPLVHGAWVTALVWSVLNAALLRVRIAAEEAALGEANAYMSRFADTPRFVPGARRAEEESGDG